MNSSGAPSAPPTRFSALLILLSLFGCSSLAPRGLQAECEVDADCAGGLICDLSQGGICVALDQPALSTLAFRIEESSGPARGGMTSDLRACDQGVAIDTKTAELHFDARSTLVGSYAVDVVSTHTPQGGCNAASCPGGDCGRAESDQEGLCTTPMAARIRFRPSSRLGWAAGSGVEISYPTAIEDDSEALNYDPIAFPRALYPESFDLAGATIEDPLPGLNPGLPTLLRIEEEQHATFYRALDLRAVETADPERGSLRIVRNRACDMGFRGRVRLLDSDVGIEGATLVATFAEALAPLSALLTHPGDLSAACTDHADCAVGWACNLVHQRCGLDLSGKLAGEVMTSQDSDGVFGSLGLDPLKIYGYCEDGYGSRMLNMELRPPAGIALPSVQFRTELAMPPPQVPGQTETRAIPADACFPRWEPGRNYPIDVVGAPIPVHLDDKVLGYCCNVGCLASPDPVVDNCVEVETLRFETALALPDNSARRTSRLAQWESDGCLPLRVDEGVIGHYAPDRVCDDEQSQSCTVLLTEGEVDSIRDYRIAVTQRVGSLFRSKVYHQKISANTSELTPIILEERSRIQGKVSLCDPEIPAAEQTCEVANASVMAERLQMPGDQDVLAPNFFEATTGDDGNFVLPLDPGVYVVTALPPPGKQGGPAGFEILDLRETPSGPYPLDFALQAGLTVTINLEEFEPNASLLPIDWGTWNRSGLVDPLGDVRDLNDPSTCYGADGCRIRRLRRSSVSQLLNKRVQFTVREIDDAPACSQ